MTDVTVCRHCKEKIEWTGLGKAYIDAEMSPFCGDSNVAHEPVPQPSAKVEVHELARKIVLKAFEAFNEAILHESPVFRFGEDDIEPFLRPYVPEGPQVECKGRKTAGDNNPGDCDWPFCDCDPKANKVIAAIQKSGYKIVKAGLPEGTRQPCDCVCHKVGLFGLMCCPCTAKALDELVNGKPSEVAAAQSTPSPAPRGNFAQIMHNICLAHGSKCATDPQIYKPGTAPEICQDCWETIRDVHLRACPRAGLAGEAGEGPGEGTCGFAANAGTVMNEAIHHTVNNAEPFEALLLPDAEWKILSRESQEKITKWFELATKFLQQILDESPAPAAPEGAAPPASETKDGQ